MPGDRSIRAMLALSTAILILAAVYFGRPILAPVTCSLLVIAIVWPLQRVLQHRLPTLLALVVTILVILLAFTALVWTTVWSFSHVGSWLISNASRFQELYGQLNVWLEGHGVSTSALALESLNVSWLLRVLQEIAGLVNGLISFACIAFIFVLLGLLEVDATKRKIASLENREAARSLLAAGAEIAAKFQKYMLVRTLISAMTGIVVWAFTLAAGLELATAWGLIAFTFNYIPFLGPLVATVFPTLFALAQSESWQVALTVFLGLNLIQLLLGSYLEPRIAGAALAISPFMVLFAIFLWSLLWGIAGAFIGVPIMIALLTICAQHESTRWIATLSSGQPRES